MISFVIPAYNEEALIGRTLDAIHEAARSIGLGSERYEIVVVDDASTDRTAAISCAHGARVVEVAKRQISAVRNAGARQARGDVFVFVDADTIVPQQTLRDALCALQEGAVAGGAAVRFDDDVSLATKLLTRILVRLFILMKSAAGCFIFCTRGAFEAAGGFDERFFASEELWISMALKKQGKFVMVRHPVITSGRKLRMYGLGRILWAMFTVGIRGPKGVQKREGLELWYDGKRE